MSANRNDFIPPTCQSRNLKGNDRSHVDFLLLLFVPYQVEEVDRTFQTKLYQDWNEISIDVWIC